MKAKILILGALLILTFACDKKHDTIEGIENYFTINGSELQPGLYIYTLVADGKEVDTKRMILTE